MKIAPNREDMVEGLKAKGWSPTQANQLGWADFWEFGATGRGTGGSSNRRFHVACKDCDTGNEFCSADSVKTFLHDHKGHKTSCFTSKERRKNERTEARQVSE